MRRMAKITGRSDDMLIIRGVNLFPTQIEEQVLKRSGLSPHFVIEVTRPDRLDEVLLQVEARDGTSTTARKADARLLCAQIKDMVGITTRVEILPPGSLPRSNGKAAHVRDLRPNDLPPY